MLKGGINILQRENELHMEEAMTVSGNQSR
jgi:hypothetical protein